MEIIKELYNLISIIDLIYIVITILSLIKCYSKGFVLSVLAMAKWLFAYVITLIAFPRIKPLLKNIIDNDHEITIEYNNSNAKFEMDGLTVICRLIDGQYPNYEAVIPNENPNVLTIDRSLLLSSLKRVSIFSNKTTHQVRLKIAGAELNISAEDVDFSNKAEERLTCDYKGEDIEIGFNSRFLIEMTNNLDCKEVKLEMSLPNRAGILRPLDGYSDDEELIMLVMPVMLNN